LDATWHAAGSVGTDRARQTDDPDALYRDRETLANVRRAVDIWQAQLATRPLDFEALWKLARARYWLGTNGLPPAQRKGALEQGVADARRASRLAPDRPEGPFWMAANMGALAESFGLRQGLRYRTDIRRELERTLALDARFMQGSADRALGRWYHKVPGMFGGSKERSEAHLRKALAYNTDSVMTRFFLAETLIELNRHAEARKELEAAIAAPLDPEWAPEDRRFREQAKQLLGKMTR